MSERTRSIVINSSVTAILCLAILTASTWWRMEAQYSIGEKAFGRGDFPAALAGYESAIHMYVPFHPTIERSAKRLWELAEQNERQGDINRALITYRALRSSFYAATWLTTPGRNWIERCDKKIAMLVPFQREK
jgi:hypothetical protein